MRIWDRKITRIKGTVALELEGGGTGYLEVDFDVSSPLASWGFERRYSDDGHDDFHLVSRVPKYPLDETYSLTIPTDSRREGPTVRITIPTDEV